MRNLLRLKFWSHGTRLGSMRPLSWQRPLIIFSDVVFLNHRDAYGTLIIAKPRVQLKKLNLFRPWCERRRLYHSWLFTSSVVTWYILRPEIYWKPCQIRTMRVPIVYTSAIVIQFEQNLWVLSEKPTKSMVGAACRGHYATLPVIAFSLASSVFDGCHQSEVELTLKPDINLVARFH